MAMHYSDQMTGASVNLMNLQCFVGKHLKYVKVVEPFLHPSGSTLGVALSPSFVELKPQDINRVRLSDVFDIAEWTDYAKSREYAPLISWEDFMRISPKNLILVHHQWQTKECDQSMVNATKEFVTENDLEVVKQVCINFRYTGVMSPQKLQKTIYGEFKPNEVVVIINRWGGIAGNVQDFRLSIRSTPCYRGKEIRHHSKQLLSDMNEYSRRYMNNTRQYVAVMVRVEHFAINRRLNRLSATVQRQKLMECFNNIVYIVKEVKREININGTLLTMDVGKHGSIYFRTEKSVLMDIHVLNKILPEFFFNMFGQTFTQEIWEDSFTSVARFDVPGYIAIMQKELAANSVCLIVAGGGSFQGSTKILYKELHPSSECIISAC